MGVREVGGVGPNYSVSQMWLSRGQGWEIQAICSLGWISCVLSDLSPTRPPMPGLPPILGTVRRVSWGPDKVSGNSGEPEELGRLVCGPGAGSPSIEPQALPSPGAGSTLPRYPGL